jgi:hypothetical protein
MPASDRKIASTAPQIAFSRLVLTILALARLGHLASPDGGETFLLRRVA